MGATRALKLFAALALLWPMAAFAQTPVLQLPVRCAMQDVCWLVRYFDHEAGPRAADYLGGNRSSDNHTGTDIGVVNYAAMVQGVPVVAAADGVVAGARDGMPDWGHQDLDPQAVQDRKCGNGVRVDHGNGWQTLYCHLRQGSVAVSTGDQVAAGHVLGMIGQSGLASFPHVEFSVLHNGEQVDPFLLEDGSTVWSAATIGQFSYAPMDIYHIGFATDVPEWADVRAGAHGATEFPAEAEALIVWFEIYSVQQGDDVRVEVFAPDGSVLLDRSDPVQKTQPRFFRFVGNKRPGSAWPIGSYRADVTISRDQNGQTISRSRSISAEFQ